MFKKHDTPAIRYDQIRYANCWEDADILMEALSPTPGSKILSIGSAGDNSFALLSSSPQQLSIIDANIFQIFLIELKKAAYQILDYPDLKRFLGFETSTDRGRQFKQISPFLSYDCRNYWNTFPSQIEKGIIFSGKLEKYFSIYRRWILPFLADKQAMKEFYQGKHTMEQKVSYERKLDRYFIKAILRLFLSKGALSRLGRSKGHFAHVRENIADYLLSKTKEYILSDDAHLNGYLRFISTGTFGTLLPFYIREENFQIIKDNLCKIELKHGYLEDILNDQERYQFFNLSNIFEYMSIEAFEKISDTLLKHSMCGAKFAYWNLFVARSISPIHKNDVYFDAELSRTLKGKDKLFFYKNFILETLK